MRKLVVAGAVFALTAGAAFAENPHFGLPNSVQTGLRAGEAVVDHTTTASIPGAEPKISIERSAELVNPAADRFGDAAPRYQH